MRSQIACAKCRISKVRCVNKGYGTTCDACAKSNRPCVYTPSTTPTSSAAGPKRRDSNQATSHDGTNGRSADATSKKRRLVPSSQPDKDKSGGAAALLPPQLFTPALWDEMFSIFERHYATDLPFLHAQSFVERLHKVDVNALANSFAALLFAFLALTTPFHADFLRSLAHGPLRTSSPFEVSRKYAAEARVRLELCDATGDPNLDTTQAMLMIGLHEWRTRQGKRCLVTIGSAIICAEMLACHVQEDLDNKHTVCKSDGDQPDLSLPRKTRLIQDEIKRRTFWSCFILDSYVSSGKRRLPKVNVDQIRIQLPCSQKAFDLGFDVRTLMINETQEQFEKRKAHARRVAQGNGHPGSAPNGSETFDLKWEDEVHQESLAWFIKSLAVYRRITEYACTITRRNEEHWPWDPRSKFYALEHSLDRLEAQLPDDLKLDPDCTLHHIQRGTYRSYVLLHSIFAICNISLHREYLPFLPWGLSKPSGPLDEPFPKEPRAGEPEGYWQRSAVKCFKTAKDFNDLMSTCKKRGVLVETPISGFAMFHVLVTVIWCRYFPQMDEQNHLCTDGSSKDELLIGNFNKSREVLNQLQTHVLMASYWSHMALRYYTYLKAARREYRKACTGHSPESNGSEGSDCRADGVTAWLQWEKPLKEFSAIDKNEENDSSDELKRDLDEIQRDLDDTPEATSPQVVKSENGDGVAETPESSSTPVPGAWSAVNKQAKPSPDPSPRKVMDKEPTYGTNAHNTVYPTQYVPRFESQQQTAVSYDHVMQDAYAPQAPMASDPVYVPQAVRTQVASNSNMSGMAPMTSAEYPLYYTANWDLSSHFLAAAEGNQNQDMYPSELDLTFTPQVYQYENPGPNL